MPNYMIVYKGEATDPSQMSEEDAAAVMEKWGAWMQKVGSALVDISTPLGGGTSVVDDGSSASATSLSGYSVVQADDMDGAVALVDGHPYLSEGKGNFAIDIYEMLPVPM